MSEPKSSKSFFADYLREQEERFQAWCTEHDIEYVLSEEDPRRKAAMERYWQEQREKNEREKLEEAEEEAKQRAYELRARIEEFNRMIPTRYITANIGEFNMGQKSRAILNGASALMLGNNGPGKTHFKWAVAREWVNAGDIVVLTKAQELLYDVKRRDDPYRYIRETYGRKVKHLVIDETDKIFESKADFVYLNYLVDFRYEWMLQTFMIGNGDKDSFLAALGQSIFSRLTGDGGVYVKFDGKDRRQSV